MRSIVKVLPLLVVFLCAAWFTAFPFEGKGHAESLLWDRNAEPDMSLYTVYSCTPNPSCTVVKAPANIMATVPQTTAPVVPSLVIPSTFEGKLAVTAKDLTGNESGLSVSIPFDLKAPVVPVNPRLGP